ncbi:MAG: GNAT family N-acetyltransferase [Bacteroidales bacterium]
MRNIKIGVAKPEHVIYVDDILTTIEQSAKVRGTGIAKRHPDYVKAKIMEGKAIIALDGDVFVGFCYMETWGHGKFVANSGLIVKPEYRGTGLAKKIKREIFNLSRTRYPEAKIFGLTTGLAVMKINTSLGYHPVTFSELTDDDAFWNGCQSCVNFDILQRTNRKICLCTGMLYDPAWEKQSAKNKTEHKQHSYQVYNRWFQFKYHVLSKIRKTKNGTKQTKEQAA